ncbi:hypothetical protein HDU96_008095 [Phlyctochytrium bullatum]|nr:hypothetical protein HDU96_008095 [Phlyctochytrium bullatum]
MSTHRPLLRILPLLLLTLLTLLLNPVPIHAQSSKFALVFTQLTLDSARQNGFTSLGIAGCERAASENSGFACTYILAPSAEPSEEAFAEHVSSKLKEDASIKHVLFLGANFVGVVKRVSSLFPSLTMSIMDATVDSSFPNNVQGITFAEDEAGFLAGVAAGSVASTAAVGVVGGNPVAPVRRYVYGFLMGAKYARSDINVYGVFVDDSTWSDQRLGAAAADAILAQNASVLFAAGGAMGSGAIIRAAGVNRTVIGVDVDESQTTFRNLTTESSRVLTSALKNVDQATYIVLTEKAQNRFFAGNKRMDVTNNGIGLATCSAGPNGACALLERQSVLADQVSCSAVQKPVKDLLSEVQGRLRAGAITTGVSEGVLQNVGREANQTWSQVYGFGPSPSGLAGHTQTKVEENLFFFYGGQTVTSQLNSNLYLYNVDSTNWTLITPSTSTAPPALQNHAAVFRRSTQSLYLLGGVKSDSTYNADLWKFDRSTSTWSIVSASNAPSPRTKHAVALIGDRWVYQWGGQDAGASVQNDLWRLDLQTAAWTRVQGTGSGGGVPEASFAASMVAVNDTDLMLFGGSNGETDLSTLWRFTTSSSSWSLLRPAGTAPPPLSNHVGVALDAHRVLYLGGSSGKVTQSSAYVYTSFTNEWLPSPTWSLRSPLIGMSAVAFNQANAPSACGWPGSFPDSRLCVPVNRTLVMVYGGVTPATGTSGRLWAAVAPDPPVPRFPQYIQDAILGMGHAVAAVGVALSLVVGTCTVVWRKKPVFKSASPAFLGMYAVGSLMAFLGIVFYNLKVEVGWCRTGVWLFSEGCMLLFSAMVVKNWRIYYIFMKSRSAQISVVKDGFLFIIIALLMTVNTVALAAFTAISPFELSTVLIDGDAWPICASPNINLWIWILLAPPALVLLFGLFISFSTRNVSSKFNESGQINLALYVTALSLIVLIPLSLTIKLPPTLHIITSLMTCLTLYTVLGSNFFMKIYTSAVRQRPEVNLHGSNGAGFHNNGPSDSWAEESEEDTLWCKVCNQALKPAGQTAVGGAGLKMRSTQRSASGTANVTSPTSAGMSRSKSVDGARVPV